VWKTGDGKRVALIPTRGTALFSVAFSPDGRQLALAGADGQIAFHDVNSGRSLKTIVPAPIEVSSR
jgi:WD40 repeat protein